jgi:hypothetical protein
MTAIYGTVDCLPNRQARATYYLNSGPLTREEFREQSKHLSGFIQAIWCPLSHELSIQWVNSTTPGKGVGTALLATCVQEGLKAGLTSVKLDDMSDRFMDDHNLYINMGMSYDEEYFPEMSGSADIMLQHWETLKSTGINPPLLYHNWEKENSQISTSQELEI